jgi:hypothetical protein
MTVRNLADPAYEPSDEDFAELTQKACAGVRDQNEAAMAKLRAGVEEARAEALRAWAEAHP